jgi:hypothetical protein
VYAGAATAHAAGRFATGDIGRAGPLDCCLARMQEAAGISLSLRDSLPYSPRQWMRLKARLDSYLARRPSVASQANTRHSASQGEVR